MKKIVENCFLLLKRFNKFKEDVLNGKEFKIPTPDSNSSENKPMNKKLFESLRKKHKV